MKQTVPLELDKRTFDVLASMIDKPDVQSLIEKYGQRYGMGEMTYERLVRAVKKAVK